MHTTNATLVFFAPFPTIAKPELIFFIQAICRPSGRESEKKISEIASLLQLGRQAWAWSASFDGVATFVRKSSLTFAPAPSASRK